MRKSTRALTALPTAAPSVGVAGPALATIQARPLERALANAAFQPGSGQSVIDWNRELITLLGTPGLLRPTPAGSPASAPAQVADQVTNTNGES
jgi:hypothetical protein